MGSERVDLLPLTASNRDHLSSYGHMDISLDPWPYAGTTTTCESLYMGVPVVSLAGESLPPSPPPAWHSLPGRKQHRRRRMARPGALIWGGGAHPYPAPGGGFVGLKSREVRESMNNKLFISQSPAHQ